MSFTYEEWKGRFPDPYFQTVPEAAFDMYSIEADIEMGTVESRWLTSQLYWVARGYFICHIAKVSEGQDAGDAQPMAPLRTTDVDGVLVEFAISREMLTNPQWLATTSYGQQYLRYRRMAFAGPRVV